MHDSDKEGFLPCIAKWLRDPPVTCRAEQEEAQRIHLAEASFTVKAAWARNVLSAPFHGNLSWKWAVNGRDCPFQREYEHYLM